MKNSQKLAVAIVGIALSFSAIGAKSVPAFAEATGTLTNNENASLVPTSQADPNHQTNVIGSSVTDLAAPKSSSQTDVGAKVPLPVEAGDKAHLVVEVGSQEVDADVCVHVNEPGCGGSGNSHPAPEPFTFAGTGLAGAIVWLMKRKVKA